MGAILSKAVTSRFPLAGENQTSEAPRVVFDPTIGEGDVETPLPNDSSKASNSPPVGGRLRSFRRDWQANNCSSNVLNIITNGYVLPFLSGMWNVFVCGLRVPPRFSPCKTHSREMAQTSGFDPTTQVKTCFDCKMFDVSNWVASLNGEDGSRGTPSHEALSVSFQRALEISSVVGQPPSLGQIPFLLT